MTIQRMDHVGIVADDLAAATEFFVALGLESRAEPQSRAAGWTVSWGSRASGQRLRSCKPRTATDGSS
jgi:catechol 2,3-dioxygenase-like lactoylglutathione lyase family enzyme